MKLAALITLAAVGTAAAGGGLWVQQRYRAEPVMLVPVTEYSHAEYREDPAGRSTFHGRYDGRTLRLVRRDDARFDFEFTSEEPHVADVAFRNVDVSLMTVKQPAWCDGDPGLTRIALIDREWNRQQVSFAVTPGADEPTDNAGAWVEVSGGDGWEAAELTKASLAKNCLNAGLWEVLLSRDEGDGQKMYYQGWFTFPLGHYADQFERNTGLDYADWWYPLEHWQDPAGTVVNLDGLRTVTGEVPAVAAFDRGEPVAVAGEQVRKARTTDGSGYVTWGDLLGRGDVSFATFVPPGKYSHDHPWGNEYWRFAAFEGGAGPHRRDPRRPPAKKLHEIELMFEHRTRRAATAVRRRRGLRRPARAAGGGLHEGPLHADGRRRPAVLPELRRPRREPAGREPLLQRAAGRGGPLGRPPQSRRRRPRAAPATPRTPR